MMIKMGTIIKTFVFQSEENNQMATIDQEIDIQCQIINLSHLFQVYCPLQNHLITIYHPIYNKFIELDSLNFKKSCIGGQIIQPRNILIRYKSKEVSLNEDKNEQPELLDQDSNNRYDKRSKQRTIGQVLELVKKWRSLHKVNCKNLNQNKKINLQQSAKIVGISKKSLDDYYSQLRLAEKYGFLFEDHLQQKIGILRLYVKENKQKLQKQKFKLNKLPKSLKIIESDTFDSYKFHSKKSSGREKQRIQKMDKILSKMIPQKRNEYLQNFLNKIEKQFYRQYEAFKCDSFIIDPFLSESDNKVHKDIKSQGKTLINF